MRMVWAMDGIQGVSSPTKYYSVWISDSALEVVVTEACGLSAAQ